MTETARGVKAELSRREFDVDCSSTWINKQELSPEAFSSLCSYFEEKRFLLAFIVRGTAYSIPEKRWTPFPNEFVFEDAHASASIPDKDFIYVQHKFPIEGTEDDFNKFIEYLKTEAFKGLNKYLWLQGKLQVL